MAREEVMAHFDEFLVAYNYATAIIHTRFSGDYNAIEAARAIVVDGTQEVIDLGYHREAMLPLLIARSACQTAIDNDAPAPAQKRFRQGYRQLLQSLGFSTPAEYITRTVLAQETFERIQLVAPTLVGIHATTIV